MLYIAQAYHLVGQQFQRPASLPIWSLATRQMNQLGFSFAIQAATFGTLAGKASRQGHLHILLHKPFFDANHGATIDLQGFGNLAISRDFVGLLSDRSSAELGRKD